MEKIDQLHAFRLFAGLSRSVLSRLAQCTVTRHYPRGRTIYREGDDAAALYLMLEGRAKSQITDEAGRVVIVNQIQNGDIFGEMELLDAQPRSMEVVTKSPCVVLAIPEVEFKRALEKSPELMQALLLHMTQQLRQAHRHIGNLATLDVVGRVERLLIDHAVESDGKVVVRDLPSQKEIARMVGASREMVNRVFKHLSLNGYLRCADGEMILRDEGVAA